jgi:hypothetical protein
MAQTAFFNMKVPGREEYNVTVSVAAAELDRRTVGCLRAHVALLYQLPAVQLRFIFQGAQLADNDRALCTLKATAAEVAIYVVGLKDAPAPDPALPANSALPPLASAEGGAAPAAAALASPPPPPPPPSPPLALPLPPAVLPPAPLALAAPPASAPTAGAPSPPPAPSARLASSPAPSPLAPPSPLLAALGAHSASLLAQMREVQAERSQLLLAASAAGTPLLAPAPSPRLSPGAVPPPQSSPLLALLSALPPAGAPPAIALPAGGSTLGSGGADAPSSRTAVRRLLGPLLGGGGAAAAAGAEHAGGSGGVHRRYRAHFSAGSDSSGGGDSSSGIGDALRARQPPAPPPLPQPQQPVPAPLFPQPPQQQQNQPAPLQVAPQPPPARPHVALRALAALQPGLLLRLSLMYFVLAQGATWERQCHVIGALACIYLFGAGFFGWVGGLLSSCGARCCGGAAGAAARGRRATPMGGLTGALLAGRGYFLCDLAAALAALLVSAVPGWDPGEELRPVAAAAP